MSHRPLRIGIYTGVLAYKPSGIGWHVIHLLDGLAALDRVNRYYLIHRVPVGGPDRPLHCPPAANFTNVPLRVPDLFFTRYFRVFDSGVLPATIRALRLDLFHGPNHYLPRRGRVPQIVTYHDVADVLFAEGADRTAREANLRRTLGRADAVIALSARTLADLEGFGLTPGRGRVIYQGSNLSSDNRPTPEQTAAARAKFNLPGRYLLFVGTLVPRKNVPLLIHAFAKLAPGLEPDARLVLAGADDGEEAARVRQLVASLGLAGRVVFTGYLTNAELAGLYGGASVFVLPSRYEGFGMILLEAMAARVPVVSTAAGSLPEVVGDAGLLVPPDDPPAMADAVRRVLNSPALAADLVARGAVRLAAFSWRTTAEQTLALYREVAGRRSR
ncbi:MAG: glycosyltransferase family 1 protein [Gemmataceae bacterium]